MAYHRDGELMTPVDGRGARGKTIKAGKMIQPIGGNNPGN